MPGIDEIFQRLNFKQIVKYLTAGNLTAGKKDKVTAGVKDPAGYDNEFHTEQDFLPPGHGEHVADKGEPYVKVTSAEVSTDRYYDDSNKTNKWAKQFNLEEQPAHFNRHLDRQGRNFTDKLLDQKGIKFRE